MHRGTTGVIRSIVILRLMNNKTPRKTVKKKDKGFKLFVVRTYVRAKNAQDALRIAKSAKPDDVYVNDDWKEGKIRELADAIGFDISEDNDDEE